MKTEECGSICPYSSVHLNMFLSFSERLKVYAVYCLLFSICDKISDKEDLKKEGVFQLKVEGIIVGEARKQKQEVVHSMASTETNQSEKGCSAQLASSFLLFIQSWTPAHVIVLSVFRMGLPTSVKALWNSPHKHA